MVRVYFHSLLELLGEKCIRERDGFDDSQKKRMFLSEETLVGIRRTAKCEVLC